LTNAIGGISHIIAMVGCVAFNVQIVLITTACCFITTICNACSQSSDLTNSQQEITDNSSESHSDSNSLDITTKENDPQESNHSLQAEKDIVLTISDKKPRVFRCNSNRKVYC